uniref:F-box domain-containing protein n=1 Tax=Mycena chlorophos TaxID=658473 RepID=A0ABQ0LFR5_MYCCL|nr:predicted protein [Mycena chlorophos]
MGHVARSWSSKPTLARLARTCRLFSSPALDELWRAVGDEALLHLAECFPADFVAISGGNSQGDPYTVTLLRAFTRSDWDRPALHARRIREFGDVSNILYPETSLFPVLTLLATCAPGPYLFPRLRRLRWKTAGTVGDALTTASLFRRFLAPELEEIILTGRKPTVLSLFPILVDRQLALRDVSILLRDDLDEFSQSLLSGFTQTLHHAAKIHIPHLDAASFAHLAQLATLTELVVAQGIHLGVLRLAVPADSYLRLHTLRLSGHADCDLLTKILPLFFARSPLEELKITPWFTTTTHDLDRLFTILPSLATPATTLQSFWLSNYNLNLVSQVSDWMIPLAAVGSLRCFTGLTSLLLGAPSGFDFGDEALGDLLAACPLLQSLTLQQSLQAATQFTHRVFLLVVRNARSLDFLHITFTTSSDVAVTTPYPTGGNGEPLTQTSLVELSVGYSRIDDPEFIAEHFSRLFPELRMIGTHWSPLPDPEEELEDDDDEAELDEAVESDKFYQRWREVETWIRERWLRSKQ